MSNVTYYTFLETLKLKSVAKKAYKEVMKLDLPASKQVEYANEKAEEAKKSQLEIEKKLEKAINIRDAKEEAWKEMYGTGDEKADAFDAGDACYEENKEVTRLVKAVIKAEGAAIGYQKAAKQILEDNPYLNNKR